MAELLPCPKCQGQDLMLLETRQGTNRRWQCACGNRFTTVSKYDFQYLDENTLVKTEVVRYLKKGMR